MSFTAQVAHRGSITATSTTDTITLSVPAGAQPGFLAIVTLIAEVDTSVPVLPAGWAPASLGFPAQVFSDVGGTTGTLLLSMFVAYKFLTEMDGSASFTFAPGGSTAIVGTMSVFSGVGDIQVFDFERRDPQNAAGTTIECAETAYLFDKEPVFVAWASNTPTVSVNIPATMKRLAEVSATNAAKVVVGFEIPSTVLPRFLGTRNATTSASQRGLSWSASLRPAVLEEAPTEEDARDFYKSITLRKRLPRNYEQSRESVNAKVLAAIGESDNAIGGLFGSANHLGESAILDQLTVKLQGSATGFNNAGTSVIVPVPAAAKPGYLLLAAVSRSETTSGAFTTPSGWTLIASSSALITEPSGFLVTSTYFRIATSSEPADYTWTNSASGSLTGIMMVYSGVDTSLPIIASSSTTRDEDSIFTANGLVAVTPNQHLVAVYATTLNMATHPLTSFVNKRSASNTTFHELYITDRKGLRNAAGQTTEKLGIVTADPQTWNGDGQSIAISLRPKLLV